MKQTMTHEEIKAAFSEIYNKFYLKHRLVDGEKRGDEDWESIISEGKAITKKYDSALVSKLVIAVMEEWEEEDRILKLKRKVSGA